MKKRVKIVLIFILVILAGGCLGYYALYFPNTRISDDGIIYIETGGAFNDVLDTLNTHGYLKNKQTFLLISRLKKYPELVKPGRYRIKNGMSNNDLVNMLRSGRQEAVNFTFNNLRTLEQLASLLSEDLNIDSLEFMELASDPEFTAKYEFTPDRFRGMFIPNTYQFYWNTTAESFIGRMKKEYDNFWNEERRNKAQQAGLSLIEVIILASIVEEETNKTKEHPIIAGVYINRLKKRIPLAACPTIKYALGDFSIQRVLKKHMTIDSPYNTYKYRGLPPGPVRMPSIQVIDAVLDYQKHDYLYFCAKSDFSGEHYFSRTLSQHNKYANEYHKALNNRKIYQ